MHPVKTKYLQFPFILVLWFFGCSSPTTTTLAPPAVVVILGAPLSIDFGMVTVGTSKDTTITLSNSGNGALVIKRETITPSFFAVTRSTDTIPAGGTISIQYRYTPLDSLGNSGYDSLVYGDSLKRTTIALRGKGYIPPPPPPSTYTYVFVGTQSGHVWRSADQGATWNDLGTAAGGSQVSSFATQNNNLYAATNAGVYASTDNGVTWSQTGSGITDNSIAALISFDNNLFVGTNSGDVFRSSDQGGSWHACEQVGQWVMDFAALGNYLFVSTISNGIDRSSNFGSTMSYASSGIPVPSVAGMVAQGGTLFAGTGSGIYRSTDFGSNWSASNNGFPSAGTSQMGSNGPIIACAGATGIYRSTDSAKSWQQVLTNPTSMLFSSIVGFGNTFFCGTVGHGLFISTDSAATWTLQTNALSSEVIDCVIFK